MKYLNLDGVSKLWEKSVAKFALKSHTHSVATTSSAGFMSAEDKSKLESSAQKTNYPGDNLLYDTNYYAPSQINSIGVYERYISTTAGDDASPTAVRVYEDLAGKTVTLSVDAKKSADNITYVSGESEHLPPSPSFMGARLEVYTSASESPVYTLDVPITSIDDLTSDYKRYYVTGTIPDVTISKIRVYYGTTCKTTVAGVLSVRRPKLELGSRGTEWVQDNWGLIDAGAKKVSKSGDTMTGSLNIQGTYYPALRLMPTNTTYGSKNLVFEGSYVGEASMSVWDTADGYNRRMLVLRGANYLNTEGTYTMDDALLLRVADDNNWTGYRVFHEGMTTAIPIKNGGTGATTAAEALNSLGALPLTGGTLTGILAVAQDSYPSISLRNSSGDLLAALQSNTADGSYSNLDLKIPTDASNRTVFTFGSTGNLWCPGTVKMGTPLGIAYGGTGAGSKSEATLGLLTYGLATDADTVKAIGHYTTDTSTTNLPITGSYGILTVTRVGYLEESSWIIQYWSSTVDNKTQVYMRKNINNQGFGSWYKLYGSDEPVSIANGGTGGTTAAQALANLGALPSSGGTVTGDIGFDNAQNYGLKWTTDDGTLIKLCPWNSSNMIRITMKPANGTEFGAFKIETNGDATFAKAIYVNGYIKGNRFRVEANNDYPTYEFKASSQTNYGGMMQMGSTNMFGFYEYPKEFDGQSTRYYEGYLLPEPSTGLTTNKVYRILTTKTVIYSSTEPSNPSTGTIWLKPV